MGDQITRAGVGFRQECREFIAGRKQECYQEITPSIDLAVTKGFVCVQNPAVLISLAFLYVSYPNTIRGRKVENSDLGVERTDEMVFKSTVVQWKEDCSAPGIGRQGNEEHSYFGWKIGEGRREKLTESFLGSRRATKDG